MASHLKRILIVGPARAGKDTACAYLAQITCLRFAGTTSRYLAPFVAEQLGVSVEEAYQTRHLNRNLWNRIGNQIRRRDPGYLIRESIAHADIVGGIRDQRELTICRQEKLVDLIVWIANDRVGADSTIKFTERECDITVLNHWSLEEFHHRLKRLAQFAGLPMQDG